MYPSTLCSHLSRKSVCTQFRNPWPIYIVSLLCLDTMHACIATASGSIHKLIFVLILVRILEKQTLTTGIKSILVDKAVQANYLSVAPG